MLCYDEFEMMKYIAVILNLPWSIVGMILALISIPKSIKVSRSPLGLVFTVKSFWWTMIAPSMKGTRAITNCNVVTLGPNILDKDLEHELVHVKQAMNRPLIAPILYQIESFRRGRKDNKYEQEAHNLSKSKYLP